MKNEALKKAISMVGSQTSLAKELGTSQQLVNYWLKNRLPSEWVLRVEKISGVGRHELRPDIYPKEDKNTMTAK